MVKSLTFIFCLLSIHIFSQAQPVTSITISLPASPNANTANWGGGTSLLTITATAKMENGRVASAAEESKLLLIIKKAGVKVCGSYTSATATSANFNTITKVWSGNQAVSFLGQSCTLLPGNYELSVQFFGNKNGAMLPVSDEKIKAFTIPSSVQQVYQAPQNIAPFDAKLFTEAALSAPIIFQWTPVIPNPNTAVKYRLKVWQLLTGQSGTQAMTINQPLIVKDVTSVTQTVVTNLVSPPCLPPYRCEFIWTVQALGSDGNPIGGTNGTSSPTTFKSELPTPPVTASNSTACNTTSTKTFSIGDEIGLSNGFSMKLSSVPTGTNTALSGKGTVYVKWLGVLNVKFKDIKVNGGDQLCMGAIYTETDANQVYPTQWAVNVLNNTSAGSWTVNKIKNISNDLQANKILKPFIPASATDQVNNTLTVAPLNMPLGYFKDNDENTAMGFTEMVFKPDHAEFEAIASFTTKGIFKDAYNNGTDIVAFQGKGIEFTKSGLSGISGSIKLLEPITFLYANSGTESLKLTFNKEGAGHIGNGLVFSATNNEYWKYTLDANVQLPNEWLVPVDPAKSNVDMNFQLEIVNWDDFVLQGNLPACTIANSNGLGIESGLIAYDHSSVSNAAGMVFPSGYTGNNNAMFSGFYLKDFKLTLPDQLRSYADTANQVQVIAQNLIIDKDGVTGKILGNNVLTYPKANIGNLGASIDTVKVSLNNSVLTEAKMLGKITLPLSSADDNGSAINYSALFLPGTGTQANSPSAITFALHPGTDITSKFLGDGKVQIDQTSSLNLTLSKSATNKREIYLAIDLNGKLYYPTGKIIDAGGNLPLDLDLSCNFQHLGMVYSKNSQESFSLSTGSWSFASPQKKLSGFAFTITEIKPKIEPIGAGTEKQYLFKGGVEFVAKINIGSENSQIQISGDTKIALTGAIESSQYTPPGAASANTTVANLNTLTSQVQTTTAIKSNNVGVITSAVKTDAGFLTQLKPKYLGVKVESINISATMPALTINGSVEFYRQDPAYGNGFKGDLQAKFTTLNTSIQAGAIFGNTKYIPGNVGNGFKYWKVEAQVNLPPPGIVFMTGVAFRGFGAGVYSRMNMTAPAVFNPATANASTFAGAVFVPDVTVKMGFKAKAIIATTPKEETFNGSVALGAQFNTSGGMNNITIDGLFSCGAEIGQEANAFANGALNISYDFPLKKFSTNLLINFNKDPISTPSGPVNAHFYIDGMKNEWAFTCGAPSTLNTVRLFDQVNINSYLMFGNKIQVPTGFMQPTIAGFASIGKPLPSFSETAVSSESKTAKGFAFGVGVVTSATNNKVISSGNKYSAGIKYSFNIGSEINASLMQYQNCPGFGDGWRIKSGIALFAKMDGKAYYDYQGTVIKEYSEINLISLGFGAYAYAEFPKPFYAEGSVSGNAQVLGLINFNFSAEFKTGEQCAGTSVDVPSVVYAQEDAEESLNYTLINSVVTPSGPTGVSRNTSFSVLLNYPDNEEFAIPEQQSSGQMSVRNFRAVYTPSLTEDATGGVVGLNSNASVVNQVSGTKLNTTNPGSLSSSNTNNIPAISAGLQNQPGTPHKPATVASGSIGLVASGYDALGARVYKLTKTGLTINSLKANTSYKFQVTGRLEEKINNIWQVVKHSTTNVPIVRMKKMYFKTNSETVGPGTTGNQQLQTAAK
ncbi:hypothetical protein [Daejeonella sp.]|uniref:hypothetical protein n=1 Tax=Daejeonella sp. TaxID=2805397 RepID=UPI0030BFF7A7